MIADWALMTLRRRRLLPATLAAAVLFAQPAANPLAAGSDTTSDASQRLVIRYVEANFALKDVETLTISDPKLPASTQLFAAYQRCRIQNMHHCLVNGQQVYCGPKRREFQRFLSDYRYFEKLDMSAEQLLHLYTLLEVPPAEMDRGISETLEDEDLALRKTYPRITPPMLQQGSDKLVLTYFWKMTGEQVVPVKRTVTISRDYRVEMSDEPLAREK